jgi:serine/threonine-protein kinase
MSDPITRLNAALEGRYTIDRELGEGGMAMVYLADDLKHERKVALKVLKPELAAVVGAERFLAEIKTTANLQHPHILPLFDSGEADSFLFYVMPFVEGETLGERIDREKQLPVEEAVRIATAVANALDHAHRNKVIHRDIKPANILLQDGEPVVADFGIALAVGVSGGRLTETGLSVGTPHYMSPEQATGDQTVGAQTDIYALGAVLYEMLVGSPPYVGATAQAILGKIIAGNLASAAEERASVPANVDATIRKSLEKLPADRFTGAQDFARALADPAFRHGAEVAAGQDASVGPWNRLSMATSALALVFALGFGWSLLKPVAPTPRPVSRQVISAAPGLPVVASPAYPDVAISPDGQNIIYQSAVGPGQLAIRALDQLEGVTLRGPAAAFGPFVSPDGEWVAFQAGAGGDALQRVSILGGPPLTISPLPLALYGASWGPDETIVFGLNAAQGLWQVPAAGGEPRPLTETGGSASHGYPDVLPNGAGVLFAINTNNTTTVDDQIAVLDLRTGEHRVIIEVGSSPKYAASGSGGSGGSSGHIIYAVGNTLRAVAFDPERLEVTSDPVPVVEGVMVKANGAASFSLSETGSLVYVSGNAAGAGGPRTAVWVDRDGREEPLPLPPRPYVNPRLSPDGTHLAVGVPDAEGIVSLWVFDVGSAAGLRLTQEGQTQTPVWTTDGRILFATNVAGGPFQLHSVMGDGSGAPELLLTSEGILGDYPTAVTPDGLNVIFSRMITAPHREILQLSLQGDPTAEPLLQGEFNRGNAEVSPDGRWLVYRSDQSGEMEVYVQPYPGPGPTVPVSIGGGTSVTWSPDGSELIYRLDDRMMVVPVEAVGETVRIGRPTELFRGPYVANLDGGTRQYHVAPDGRFLMLKEFATESPGDNLPPQVVLVQNWFEELRERVPD